MKTPEQIWGHEAHPEPGWLARNMDLNATIAIEVEPTKPTKQPGVAAMGVAKFFCHCGGAALLLLAGLFSKELGYTLFTWGFDAAVFGVLALGFALYAWGARSATRHAAKGEDTER